MARAEALLAAALLFAATLARADELKPFEASYEWSWHGMTVAVSSLKLERNGETWVYSSRSSPRGIGRAFAERPVQKSILRLVDKGVRPLSYDADDGTSATKRDAHVMFDWENGRVTGVYEDVKVDMPLQPGIQDDLSVHIALMVELLAGREPQQFQMLDGNAVRGLHFTRGGEEPVATPFGKIDTIVYAAQKTGSPRIIRFWCAPSRGYIPLRVQQKKADDVQWTMQVQAVKRE